MLSSDPAKGHYEYWRELPTNSILGQWKVSNEYPSHIYHGHTPSTFVIHNASGKATIEYINRKNELDDAEINVEQNVVIESDYMKICKGDSAAGNFEFRGSGTNKSISGQWSASNEFSGRIYSGRTVRKVLITVNKGSVKVEVNGESAGKTDHKYGEREYEGWQVTVRSNNGPATGTFTIK